MRTLKTLTVALLLVCGSMTTQAVAGNGNGQTWGEFFSGTRPTPLEFRSAMLRLRAGMTEPEVIAAVGRVPDYIEMQTCGEATSHPWSCRVLRWRGGVWKEFIITLDILFEWDTDARRWIADEWQVTP